MGLFSKTCAKTHLPVLAAFGWQKQAERLTRIVSLLPGDTEAPLVEDYDGYGQRLADFDQAKFVLASDYAGETYEQLGESHDEPNQGWFHNEELMSVLAASNGFAKFDDYFDLLCDFENEQDAITEEVMTALGISAIRIIVWCAHSRNLNGMHYR